MAVTLFDQYNSKTKTWPKQINASVSGKSVHPDWKLIQSDYYRVVSTAGNVHYFYIWHRNHLSVFFLKHELNTTRFLFAGKSHLRRGDEILAISIVTYLYQGNAYCSVNMGSHLPILIWNILVVLISINTNFTNWWQIHANLFVVASNTMSDIFNFTKLIWTVSEWLSVVKLYLSLLPGK